MDDTNQEPERRTLPPEVLWTAEAMAEEYESTNTLRDELQRTLHRFRDKEGELVSPATEAAAERKRLQDELSQLEAEVTVLKGRRCLIRAELSEVNAGWNQAQKDDSLMRETARKAARLDKERVEKKKKLREYLVKWRLLDEEGNFMGLNYTKPTSNAQDQNG